MAVPSLLTALRDATREAHAALDRRLHFDDAAPQERYIAFLRATLSVVAPLETTIGNSIAPYFDWNADLESQGSSVRAGALARDLSALGASPSVAPLALLPDVSSPAAGLGAAYVLLGSMLGGAVIARMLQRQAGIGPDKTTYLRLYGEALSSVWEAFTARLDAFGAECPRPDRLMTIDTARGLFDAFDRALTREGLP